ncbi:hypothetical protein LDC_0498, partial [sediment metagenome]
ASLSLGNLPEGSYRIELAGGDDLLITCLRVNQGKLVAAGSVFLAGMTPAYFGEEGLEFAAAGLYGQNFGPRQLTLSTLHSVGLQQVTIIGDDYTSTAGVNDVNKGYRINAYDGPYCLIAPKQDLTIDFNGLPVLHAGIVLLPATLRDSGFAVFNAVDKQQRGLRCHGLRRLYGAAQRSGLAGGSGYLGCGGP